MRDFKWKEFMKAGSVNFILMIILPFGFYFSMQAGQDWLMNVLLVVFVMNMFLALIQ